MKKILCIGMLLTGLGLFLAPSVMALSIGFDPAEQVVNVGEIFDVDIIISGSGTGPGSEIVSAYDLDVFYDPLVFNATNVAFGIYLPPPTILQSSNLAIAGLVDIKEISLASNLELEAQPDTFALATVSFEAIALGASLLEFSFKEPNYVLGPNPLSPLQLEVHNGKVAAVPEPATLLLLGVGLAGLAGIRRKKFNRKTQ